MPAKHSAGAWGCMRVVFAVASLCAGQAASAQGVGEWYAGVGVGSAHIEVYRGSWFGYGAWEAGDSDTALLAYGGYRLTRNFALDISYFTPADLKWREEGAYVEDLPAGFYDSRTSLTTSALQLSVVGILPFASRWEAYLKGGVSAYKSDGTQTLTDLLTNEVVSRTLGGSKTGFLLGMGIAVTPEDQWRFRFEYQLFYIDHALINVGPYSDPTLDTWMFGADYRFGAAR
jgi:opacity protein-like surface antigen